MGVQDYRHLRPTKFCIQPLFPPGKITTTTNQIPQGVSKGVIGLSTRNQDGTKDSSGYNVPGYEGVVETHTTTYLRIEATIYVRYVPYADR